VQAAAWHAAVSAQAHAEQLHGGSSPAAFDPVGQSRKRKGNRPQPLQPYPPPHDYGELMQATQLNQPTRAATLAYSAAGAYPARVRFPVAAAVPTVTPEHLLASTPPRAPPLRALPVGMSSAAAASAGPGSAFGVSHASSLPAPLMAHERAVLTLGVEVAEDSMCPVIVRGTPLPCSITQVFSTYVDHQPGVSIFVYQGQRASTRHNQFLGRLDLLGIRAAPRGVPRIEVTFTLDVFGLLKVTANESLQGGSVLPLMVQSHFDPPVKYWQTAEVERILKDAELHRVEDAHLTARTATKSRLEQYVYGLRTSLEQHAWRRLLTAEEVQVIQQQHEACIQWLAANDHAAVRPEDFQRKLNEVLTICQPIILKIYEADASGNADPSPQASAITSSPYESVMADVSPAPGPMALATAAAAAAAAAPAQHYQPMVTPTRAVDAQQSQPRLSLEISPQPTLATVAATVSTRSSLTSSVAPSTAVTAPAANTAPAAAAAAAAAQPPAAPPSGSPSASRYLSPSPSTTSQWQQGTLSELLSPPPLQGTHASPESRSYGALYAATSSSPLISSLAHPWSTAWTHPSLLTSPILASSNYHVHSTDFPLHSSAGRNLSPGRFYSSNGHGGASAAGVTGSVGSSFSSGLHVGGSGTQSSPSGGLVPPSSASLDEAYMDFLIFPNSATFNVTPPVAAGTGASPTVNASAAISSSSPTDAAAAATASGEGTASASSSFRAPPIPLSLESRVLSRYADLDLRLRGGTGAGHAFEDEEDVDEGDRRDEQDEQQTQQQQ